MNLKGESCINRYPFKDRKSSKCTHSIKWLLHGRETGKRYANHIPLHQSMRTEWRQALTARELQASSSRVFSPGPSPDDDKTSAVPMFM